MASILLTRSIISAPLYQLHNRDIPIGFGLFGDLVVNKPCDSVSQGVLTSRE